MLNKNQLRILLNIYQEQEWLKEREEALIEIIQYSDKSNTLELVTNMLARFNFLNESQLNGYLSDISRFIVESSGFDESMTQIVAMAYDNEADSSQTILQFLKTKLNSHGWSKFKTTSYLGAAFKNVNKYGLKNIVLIDEFTGSGKTVLNRIKEIEKNLKYFRLIICLVAGMNHALEVIKESNYTLYCPLILHRGLTDYYSGPELEESISQMKMLESSLQKVIINGDDKFDLDDYSLGYNGAEALYSGESVVGNSPNSVFPLFWWPRDDNSEKRKTVLNRYERGLI